MTGDLFAPSRLFTTCMADPPWKESGGGKIKRGADRHYPLMKTEEIAALQVARHMEPNAHLYLWVTNNFLEDGLHVMRAWGFKYVTNICWGKVRQQDGVTIVQQGLGQYFRGSHELLLFGKRGKIPYRKTAEGKRAQHPSLVLAPRGEHSEKPAIFRTIAEKVSPGPYVELFARERVAGWEAWGNEVETSINLERAA